VLRAPWAPAARPGRHAMARSGGPLDSPSGGQWEAALAWRWLPQRGPGRVVPIRPGVVTLLVGVLSPRYLLRWPVPTPMSTAGFPQRTHDSNRATYYATAAETPTIAGLAVREQAKGRLSIKSGSPPTARSGTCAGTPSAAKCPCRPRRAGRHRPPAPTADEPMTSDATRSGCMVPTAATVRTTDDLQRPSRCGHLRRRPRTGQERT
jgi:hypothetical protein